MYLSEFEIAEFVATTAVTTITLYISTKLLAEEEGIKTALYVGVLANVINFFLRIGVDYFKPFAFLNPYVSVPLTLIVWIVLIKTKYSVDILKALVIAILQVVIAELFIDFGLLNFITSKFGFLNIPIEYY